MRVRYAVNSTHLASSEASWEEGWGHVISTQAVAVLLSSASPPPS